jgi:transposase InsO family protein
LAQLDKLGCRPVTRFKTNTPLNEPREIAVAPDRACSATGLVFCLPARTRVARNGGHDRGWRDLAPVDNGLDAPAQEVADLYKRRWRIELFFRLMKQTLRIAKFIGRSESAVRIAELPRWLHRYNWHRPHGSIGSKPPTTRVAATSDNLLRLHS